MRLSSMIIKNFKGIDEDGVRIDFSPITLLFGPNNSGKSTIIQALHIVKEFFCSKNPDFDNIPVANLGNFQNYVHKHELNRNIYIEILLKPYTESDKFLGYSDNHYFNRFILESYQGKLIFPLGISFILSWDENLYKSSIKVITISLNNEPFLRIDVVHNTSGNKLTIDGHLSALTKTAKEFIEFYYKLQEDKLSHVKGCEYHPVHPLTIPINSSGVPDWYSAYAVTASYTDWSVIGVEREEDTNLNISYSTHSDHTKVKINNPEHSISNTILLPCRAAIDIFNNFISLGPIRSIPSAKDLIPQKVTSERWNTGLSAWSTLFNIEPWKLSLINDALLNKDLLNIGFEIIIKKYITLDCESTLYKALHDYTRGCAVSNLSTLLSEFLTKVPKFQIWLKNYHTNTLLRPQDMGSGIAQIISVVIASIVSKRDSLVSIEQPELHIHPAWQVALGDVFVNSNKNLTKIFIVETHSEHLMLRLLRRIRETYENELPQGFPKVTNSMVSVCYVQPNNMNNTEVRNIPITEDGDFASRWPNGIFEERTRELF